MCSVSWNVINVGQIVHVLFECLRDKFPCDSLTSLDLRAGIPSMRKPASREMISAFVERQVSSYLIFGVVELVW